MIKTKNQNQHWRKPLSRLPNVLCAWFPIETRHSSPVFGTACLLILYIQQSIFDLLWKVIQVPCTQYSSSTGAKSTSCRQWMLVASFLLLHRQTQPLLPRFSTSHISLSKWRLQLSPHRLVHYRGSGSVLYQVLIPQLFPLLISGSALWDFHSDIV